METPKAWIFTLLAMALFFIGAELIPAAAASESGTGEAENGADRHCTAAALGLALVSTALTGIVARMA